MAEIKSKDEVKEIIDRYENYVVIGYDEESSGTTAIAINGGSLSIGVHLSELLLQNPSIYYNLTKAFFAAAKVTHDAMDKATKVDTSCSEG